MPSAPAAAFTALRRRGVRWVVLREGPGIAGDGEVDVLVHPDDELLVEQALAEAGFTPVPSWGRGSHRFWRTYDQQGGGWHVLDVVSELAFGQYQELVVGQVGDCLARRHDDGMLARPADDDAFWLLVAHCLFDKGRVPERHRATLTGLLAASATDGPFSRALEVVLGPDVTLDEVTRLIADERWDEVAGVGRDARRRAMRRQPRALSRWASNWLMRHSGKLQTAIRRRGLTVAVVGPDGAGKSSTIAAVGEELRLPVRRQYLGMYGAAAPGAPAWIPAGDLVVKLAWLIAQVVVARWHVLRGRVVLLDRHPVDLEVAPSRPGRAGLRRRILVAACPAPNLLVVLDAPGPVLHDRSGQHDPDRLEELRHRYLERAGQTANAVVIDATATPEQVRDHVVAAIWQAGARRWSRD